MKYLQDVRQLPEETCTNCKFEGGIIRITHHYQSDNKKETSTDISHYCGQCRTEDIQGCSYYTDPVLIP